MRSPLRSVSHSLCACCVQGGRVDGRLRSIFRRSVGTWNRQLRRSSRLVAGPAASQVRPNGHCLLVPLNNRRRRLVLARIWHGCMTTLRRALMSALVGPKLDNSTANRRVLSNDSGQRRSERVEPPGRVYRHERHIGVVSTYGHHSLFEEAPLHNLRW